jgi:hypothetical protein
MGASLASGNELRTLCGDGSHTSFMLSVTQHTFIQPNKPILEGTAASSWITKNRKTKFRSTGAYLGGDQTPLLSSHVLAYSDEPGSYLFKFGATPNFPGSWGFYPDSAGGYGPEASDSIGGSSSHPAGSCPQEPDHRPDIQGGKNANFGLSHSWPMHQKFCRSDEGNKVTKTIFTGSRDIMW